MKKRLPFILLGLVLIGLFLLIYSARTKRHSRIFNENVVLDKGLKIPYGLAISYAGLKTQFPEASIQVKPAGSDYIQRLKSFTQNTGIVIITDEFTPSVEEINNLATFATYGNQVFISARSVNYVCEKAFDIVTDQAVDFTSPKLSLELQPVISQKKNKYGYPGKYYASPVRKYNDTLADVLARDENARPMMLRYHLGNGNIYLNFAPLSFSNYFLLYKDNFRYYEEVMSVMPRDLKTIYWDEYFYNKEWSPADSQEIKKDNWWSVMMRYPSMKAALLTALFTLILYILSEMRRRRRLIPLVSRPKNDSLEFVRTIGRLYHERGNHQNLAVKMGTYFLEHIRARYRMATTTLDDDFIQNLHYKSGFPENDLRYLVLFIRDLDGRNSISDFELNTFYNQLEKFYQNT